MDRRRAALPRRTSSALAPTLMIWVLSAWLPGRATTAPDVSRPTPESHAPRVDGGHGPACGTARPPALDTYEFLEHSTGVLGRIAC